MIKVKTAVQCAQFGPGAMQQHGFARNLEWEIGSTSADLQPDERDPEVELVLTDNDYTRAMWCGPRLILVIVMTRFATCGALVVGSDPMARKVAHQSCSGRTEGVSTDHRWQTGLGIAS